MGFDFIMIASSYHLIVAPPLSLDVGIVLLLLLLLGSSVLLLDSSTDSCVLGAFA